MFDPLDFLSVGDPAIQSSAGIETTHVWEETGPEEDQTKEIIPLQLIDLPSLKYAPAYVIWVVLVILAPSENLNFRVHVDDCAEHDIDIKQICSAKNLDYQQFHETYEWFCEHWAMEVYCLQSEKDFFTQLQTISRIDQNEQLSYYTSILSYYNKIASENPDDVSAEEVLKQCSLRISEKCGRSAQPATTKIFQLDGLSEQILMHEPGLVGDSLGLKTWGAALPLSQRLMPMRFPNDFLKSGLNQWGDSSLQVLELGAGTGLVGISFALKVMAGNQRRDIAMWLTDLPEIVPNLQKNVELNKLHDTVKAEVLDWTDHSSFLAANPATLRNVDVILIADPIYSPNHPQWVVSTIKVFLKSTGLVFLEIPKRDKYESERQMLWDLLRSNGLAILEEDLEDGFDDFGHTQYIYKKIGYM